MVSKDKEFQHWQSFAAYHSPDVEHPIVELIVILSGRMIGHHQNHSHTVGLAADIRVAAVR